MRVTPLQQLLKTSERNAESAFGAAAHDGFEDFDGDGTGEGVFEEFPDPAGGAVTETGKRGFSIGYRAETLGIDNGDLVTRHMDEWYSFLESRNE